MKDNQVKSAEDKVFFDTNILVYSADVSDARKQKIATALIKSAIDSGNGVISTQCLQEFFNVAQKKLNISKEAAKELVEYFADNLPVIEISVPLILSAVDISIKSQFSFWDSLILSAASDTGCATVYSEDLNDQQIIAGARIENPFAA
ncbi:MAG: PIN domain-containing protein [Treponema sp.]|nr:PIN domain-containing protein [Treponema sp.]